MNYKTISINKKIKLIKYVLSKKPDVNLGDKFNRTPLADAISSNNTIIIDILINIDSEFFLEFVFSNNNTKILIHTININLSSLSKYYKITNNI